MQTSIGFNLDCFISGDVLLVRKKDSSRDLFVLIMENLKQKSRLLLQYGYDAKFSVRFNDMKKGNSSKTILLIF